MQSPSGSMYLTAPDSTEFASGSPPRQADRVEPSASPLRQPASATRSRALASDPAGSVHQLATGDPSHARYAPTPRVFTRRAPRPTTVVPGRHGARSEPDQAGSPGSSAPGSSSLMPALATEDPGSPDAPASSGSGDSAAACTAAPTGSSAPERHLTPAFKQEQLNMLIIKPNIV